MFSRKRKLRIPTDSSSILLLFEHTGLLVLPHVIPCEYPTVHGNVDPMRQTLHKAEGVAQIEVSIAGAKAHRNHSAGNDDGLRQFGRCQICSSQVHRIRTMSDQDALFFCLAAVAEYGLPLCVGHVQTIYHHQCSYAQVKVASPQAEQFRQLCIAEKQPSLYLIIFLIESSSGDEYTNGLHHGMLLSYKFTNRLSTVVEGAAHDIHTSGQIAYEDSLFCPAGSYYPTLY